MSHWNSGNGHVRKCGTNVLICFVVHSLMFTDKGLLKKTSCLIGQGGFGKVYLAKDLTKGTSASLSFEWSKIIGY